jgi:hypothetical protein
MKLRCAELDLVAVENVPVSDVPGENRRVDLGVDVLERRVVRRVLQVEEVDLVASVRGPRPEVVLDDRTADLDAVVLTSLTRLPPVAPWSTASCGRLFHCQSPSARKNRADPCTWFVPRFVTRFSWTPGVEAVTSLPPVVAWTSWNESKS